MESDLEIRKLKAQAYLKRKAMQREDKAIERVIDGILLGLIVVLYCLIAAMI